VVAGQAWGALDPGVVGAEEEEVPDTSTTPLVITVAELGKRAIARRCLRTVFIAGDPMRLRATLDGR